MANRRMFSMKIVDTDAFLDMPQSAQLLYFHLAMRADDDGFVASPKKIMRMLGSNDDDIKVLVSKKFVIPFESGVCVIKHWLIHNYIQTDRYQPTQWVKEKEQLLIDDKTKKYSLNRGQSEMDTKCIQDVSKVDTQVRLGKVRLGKVISSPTPSATASQEEVTIEPDDDTLPIKAFKKRDAKKQGYKGDLVKPIRFCAEARIGRKYPSPLKQEKFISQMLYAGYTRQQIEEQFEALFYDDFWGKKGFDFATVANEISKAKKPVEKHEEYSGVKSTKV